MNNEKLTEANGTRQPRPVFYEPHHAPEVTEQIRLALALAGYVLTRDEDAMPDDESLEGAWAMVTENPDGALILHDGDTGISLPPVTDFATPAAYAGAIAAWLDGGGDNVVDPAERDPERDELVDIDAVRSGSVDVADMPTVLELLCDEVEALREQHAKFRALYNKNVGSLVDQLDEATSQECTGWTVHLTNGLLTGYPTWQRAVVAAGAFLRHQVVRISGPEGTVPLVGAALSRELSGGAR